MDPQTTRFLCEEILEDRVGFVPTYGNTLMGLAAHKPDLKADNYSITYYAPQPRALLRCVDPEKTDEVVDVDSWGRVELTTLTKEFFMPRFLERDEALRRAPCEQYADGVGEVRPFGQQAAKIVEVYEAPHPRAAARRRAESLDQSELRGIGSDEVLARISQSNAGMIKRDLRRAEEAAAAPPKQRAADRDLQGSRRAVPQRRCRSTSRATHRPPMNTSRP